MSKFTIEKMLFRSRHDEYPQLYIVLGRAEKAGEKIHVQFPELCHFSVNPPSSITVTAISRKSNTRHEFLELEPGQCYWEARFYIEEDPDLNGLLKWMIDDPYADDDTMRRCITVEAWSGTRKEKSNIIPHSFSIIDLIPEYQFEVGVLLVHGIGSHRPRETLIRFGEPLVKFLDDWLGGVNDHAARNSSTEDAEKYKKEVYSSVLHNRQDLYGINKVVGDFAKNASLKQYQSIQPHSTSETDEHKKIMLGNARIDDTVIGSQQQRAETPNSALLRLSTLSPRGDIQEAHILLSESWWTDRAVLPDWKELWQWIWSSFPIVLAGYMSGVFLRILHNITNRKHTEGIFNHILSLFSSLFSLAGALLFLLIVNPLTLIGCVVLQALLSLIALPALLPIPWVRKLVGIVIETLLSTVGQSYALKTSRVRRAAIVGSVAQDLEWLSMRCKNILIVAHSQGAEVSRLVLGGKIWNRIKGWVTLGSGINPLTMLDHKEKTHHAKIIAILTAFLGLHALIALISYAYVPVSVNEIVERLGFSTVQELLCNAGELSYITLLMISVVFILLPRPREGTFRKSVIGKWKDYYASHDPVPNGPGLNDKDIEKLNKENCYPAFYEIDNAGSILRDHTSYFDNREQFIAPLSLEIAGTAGIDLKDLRPGDHERLEEAKKRRHLFVQQRMWIRNFTVVLCVVAMLFIVTLFLQDLSFFFHKIYTDLLLDPQKMLFTLRDLGAYTIFHRALPLFSVLAFYLGEKFILQRKIKENYSSLVQHRPFRNSPWTGRYVRFLYTVLACGITAYWWQFVVM